MILPAANKTYYRVVAVDSEGTWSGPSDYAVAPRPVIYSKPTFQAKVGAGYRGQVSANRSLGDLRKHNPEVANSWDIEHPKYALKGPGWLKLEADTGALSGTPDAAGKFESAPLHRRQAVATGGFRDHALVEFGDQRLALRHGLPHGREGQ